MLTLAGMAVSLYGLYTWFYARPNADTTPKIPREHIQLSNGVMLAGPDKILGQGAFGVVATYTYGSLAVAVKIPKAPQDNESQQHELTMLKQASPHANIVRLMTSERVKGKLYLILELMKGTVTNLLQAHPHLSWKTKLSVAIQLLTGIVHLHTLNSSTFTRKSMVHQDLKPDNLLVDKLEDNPNIRVKISDFGMARIVDEFKVPLLGTIAKQATEGPTGGTYQYMAPEVVQMLTTQDISAPSRGSDIFSAGVILWEIATQIAPNRKKLDIEQGSFPNFQKDHNQSRKKESINIWRQKTVVEYKSYPMSQFFGPVIAKCIQPKSSQREDATKVLSDLQQIVIS